MVFEKGQTSNNKIQLFISFRGQDERLKLLPHLEHHLRESNVNVFVDADNIGEPLINLFKHIRNSRIVIVIFSINFLESRWCLEELVHIKKCLFTEKIDFAIPIFYNVKASHVKDQSGDFGTKFLGLHEMYPESIKRWKKALTVVGNYGGLSYDKNGLISELDFITKVVNQVDKLLNKITSKEGDNNYNSSISTYKRSEEEAANLAQFNVVMDDMNRLYHVSEALEALDLERRSIEEYNRAIYLKELSRTNPPYIEEEPWTLEDNSPHDWPHLEHRRNNSVPNIYQIYPPISDERTIVQYHPVENQVSNDNIRKNETIVVHNHSVNTIQQDETKAVQNSPVINEVGKGNIQQDDITEIQNHPVIKEVSKDNIQQSDMTKIQSINKNDLQRKCYEKCNEDINCVVFMWYCFKLWLSKKKDGESEDLRVSQNQSFCCNQHLLYH